MKRLLVVLVAFVFATSAKAQLKLKEKSDTVAVWKQKKNKLMFLKHEDSVVVVAQKKLTKVEIRTLLVQIQTLKEKIRTQASAEKVMLRNGEIQEEQAEHLKKWQVYTALETALNKIKFV